VGLLLDGGELPRRLERFFEGDWESSYASTAAKAAAPRVDK
jgi:hypothetical protein